MIRVGVVRGGTGNKYAESLQGGAYILKNLPRDKYEVLDIFLDKDGVWHMGGVPISHERLKLRVDVIWNALHGFYGEDGKLPQFLDMHGIPYTGAGALSSAIAMNKKLTKDQLSKLGIKTPRGIYIEHWGEGDKQEIVGEVVRAVSAKFSPPWIVEPISRAGGVGALRARTRDELSVILEEMCALDIPTLVEEEVFGREVSVMCASGLRGQEVYTFLPQEKGKKRTSMKKSECDAFCKIARDAHQSLALAPYSKVTGVVTPKGHMYVTKIETMPAFSPDSDLHQGLESLGVSFAEFADHLLGFALKKKGR